MPAGGQYLDLGHAVEQVVVRLAHRGAGHADAARAVHQLGDAPGAEVGHAPVADLARAQQRLDGEQRLLQVHVLVVAVQVDDVHVVGLQAREAGLHLAQHPGARVAALVHAVGHLVAQLGRQHPVVALALEQPAQHGLGRALGVHVARVHVVHAVLARMGDDGRGLGLVRLVAEHHGAQAQGGDLELALAEEAVLHGEPFTIEKRACSACWTGAGGQF